MADYLILIGGTGARVAESFVHICDNGYFSKDEVRMLLIDADSSCGNKNAAVECIRKYNSCGNYFRQDDFPLFKTNLVPVFTQDSLDYKQDVYDISPVDSEQNSSFTIRNQLVGNNRDAAWLAKALYSEEEYGKNIKNGFYAHPSIGALMFTQWMQDKENKFYNMIKNMINDLNSGDDVNVFVVASVFGGTGASGFPAIAKTIKKALKESNIEKKDKLRISGCLLMPYFTYLDNNMSDEEKRIQQTEFDLNAKNALVFYDNKKILSDYESIYLLGNPQKLIRGEYHDAGDEQRNWPHILELYAALSARDFFISKDERQQENQEKNAKTMWKATATRELEIRKFGWDDFPDNQNLKGAFERFLLFNYIYECAVVSEVCKMDQGGNALKLKSRTTNKNMCPQCINYEPFTVNKGRDWADKFGEESFEKLQFYFDDYTKWLFKLIHKYKDESAYYEKEPAKQDILINQLFKTASLANRAYRDVRIKNAENIESAYLEEINEFYSQQIINGILKDNRKAKQIYNKITHISVKALDVQKAIKILVKEAYEICAKY